MLWDNGNTFCCHVIKTVAISCGDQQPLSITGGFQFPTAIKCYWGLTMISKYSATIIDHHSPESSYFYSSPKSSQLTAACCLCCCGSPELSYPLLFLTVDFGQLHQTLKSCHLHLTSVKSGWLLWPSCQPLINRIWSTTRQLSMSFPIMFLSTKHAIKVHIKLVVTLEVIKALTSEVS
ncbi:hypothetical protein TSUD_388700 [Trifolium subterraneum]|uniref:Uncharacterized protein n=1 Tax=Trifolium subterraneum TaxID=3900 RepID=A0A2Z6N4I3_TRISU|nr:hypothetical protein TSUD_388700 [Trifolium subterraneum]